MFEENENLVTEEVTENVEETTEETLEGAEQVAEPTITEPVEETFTKAQVDEMIAKKLARKEAKIRKDYDRKYEKLERVLRAGTGKEDLGEITDTFEDFYTKKGIDIPTEPTYSDRQLGFIAKGEADEIISAGYDEVVEEVDRLAEIGFDNMTPTEKATFQRLAEYRQTAERQKELAKIGLKEDFYESKDFKDFASKFNSNTPIKDIYDLYVKVQPKPKYEQVGSMKNTQVEKVKDHYSAEDIARLTDEDLDDPQIWEAVRRSMTGRS